MRWRREKLRSMVAFGVLAAAMACGADDLSSTDPGSARPATVGDGHEEQGAVDGPEEDTPLEVVPTVAEEVRDRRRGPPYPVVLAHGLNGFRDLGPVDYFFRVPGALTEAGEEVYVSAVPPYDGSADRARILASEIDRVLHESGARKVNLIAHSQGGLDSRYLISTLGYGDRVASLTTVSTPHHGTKVADLIRNNEFPLEEEIINAYAWLFGSLSADTQNDPDARAALESLSYEGMRRFNQANRDDGRVQYFSFAGRSNLQRADEQCQCEWPNPEAIDTIEPALLATWFVLAEDVLHPKANDGLVSVESARWGRFMACLPADHGDEIGQIADLLPELVSGWNHVQFYKDWVAFLRTQGL